VLALAGCLASRPTAVAPQPLTASAPVESGAFVTPAGRAADWYFTPPSRPYTEPDKVRRVIVGRLFQAIRQAGLQRPVRDRRLDAVADDLATVTPDKATPSLELTTFLMNHYGIVEPEPELFTASGGPSSEEALGELLVEGVLATLRRHPGGRLGLGFQRRDEELVVVLALQEFHLDLRPVPRTVDPGVVVEIDARLLDGYRNPRVIITSPSGGVDESEPRVRGDRQQSRFSCRRDRRGEYQIEMAAESDRGPVVLAVFPIYCGVAAPVRSPQLPLQTSGPQDPAAAEVEIYQLINRDRIARGISPLRRDRHLDEVARRYSREMASTGVVAHRSTLSGDAGDRIKAAGINSFSVAENVSRSYSGREAHRELMSSPGHRGNIIDPAVNVVGIGVAAGPLSHGAQILYVTEMFIQTR
jgi:uncharacterized protein YkwD